MPARKVLVTDYAWESLDVEREILAQVGAELVVAQTGEEAELASLASEIDGIMTCWKPVTRSVLDSAPRCLVVARYGIGLDNIDVARADELGMIVTNTPGYCVDEVAEHALALVLALRRRVVQFARQTAGGGWDNTACGPLRRLRGQTLGIVGFGELGQAVAERATGLGMRVVAHSRSAPPNTRPDGVELVATLDEVLECADVVSLHLPLTSETRGLIGADQLARMKRGALLVNTARGAIVDAAALADALERGHLAGAGLDVLPEEPPPPDDPLLRMEQVIVTPHAAFFSAESTLELQQRAAGSVRDVLGGSVPPDVVNMDVLAGDRLRATALRATAPR